MKKLLCLTLCAVLVLSLSGCSLLSAIEGKYAQKAPEVSGLVPSVDNIGDIDETEGLNKTIVCPMEDSMYPAAHIELKEDLTFKMQVNLYEGFGDILGTYEEDGNGNLSLEVTEKNFSGFAGDTLESFKLIKLSDTSYEIKFDGIDHVGAIHSGAVLSENE